MPRKAGRTRLDQLNSIIDRLQARLKKLSRERRNLKLRASAAERKQVLNAMRRKQRQVLEALQKGNPKLYRAITQAAVEAAGRTLPIGRRRRRRVKSSG